VRGRWLSADRFDLVIGIIGFALGIGGLSSAVWAVPSAVAWGSLVVATLGAVILLVIVRVLQSAH